jgi:hypothetical protein
VQVLAGVQSFLSGRQTITELLNKLLLGVQGLMLYYQNLMKKISPLSEKRKIL